MEESCRDFFLLAAFAKRAGDLSCTHLLVRFESKDPVCGFSLVATLIARHACDYTFYWRKC